MCNLTLSVSGAFIREGQFWAPDKDKQLFLYFILFHLPYKLLGNSFEFLNSRLWKHPLKSISFWLNNRIQVFVVHFYSFSLSGLWCGHRPALHHMKLIIPVILPWLTQRCPYTQMTRAWSHNTCGRARSPSGRLSVSFVALCFCEWSLAGQETTQRSKYNFGDHRLQMFRKRWKTFWLFVQVCVQ